MNCPYCGKEMEKGFIQCRDGVSWQKKERLIAALPGLSKGSVILARSHGSLFSGAAAIAYHCSGCKKIVIDYEQESDANEDAETEFMRL